MASTNDEFALIDWIRERVGPHQRLLLGIGDDTASCQLSPSGECLMTVDMLMEGVHFTLPSVVPRDVGRKALAVNLSDIAAMAGKPLAALVSVACPRHAGPDFARDVHNGLQDLADEFDVAIAGGDTNVWNGPAVVSVTLFGEPTGTGPVLRSGAQPGDWILTTGDFGASLAGKHVSFHPRVDDARILHAATSLHAMIDVSDGLAADLHHILNESRVGAVLEADRIPLSAAALATSDDKSPLEHALGDGEDFELLFTLAAEEARELLEQAPIDVRLTRIGEIVTGRTCELIDASGHHSPLPPQGWQHTF